MKSAKQEEIIGYIHNEMIQASNRGLTEVHLFLEKFMLNILEIRYHVGIEG